MWNKTLADCYDISKCLNALCPYSVPVFIYDIIAQFFRRKTFNNNQVLHNLQSFETHTTYFLAKKNFLLQSKIYTLHRILYDRTSILGRYLQENFTSC